MEAFLGGGWFVTYILIAYMAFYIIRRFHMPLWGALCGNIIIVALLYFDLPFEKGYVLFRNYAIKGFVLFIFMLIGAMLSSTQKKGGASSRWPMVAFLLSFGVFNVLAILISNRFISSKVQVLVILPLIGAVIALYWVASSVCDKIKNGAGRDVILVVGGLCLELYLTYGLVRTTLFNAIFPLNIAINLMIGLLCAYLTRCLSRMFRQTFNAGNYDWGSVVRLKP